METDQGATKTRLCPLCIASVAASLLSVVAFVLYGKFHQIAHGARFTGTDPGVFNYHLVDTMKSLNVLLAALALGLAVMHWHKTSRPFRTVALVIAGVACLTVPILT
jgi:hypothetical protein